MRLVKARVCNLHVRRVPQGLVGTGAQLAQQLFDTYQPQILVMEKTDGPGSRRSRHLPAMTAAITALARERGITVVEYTRTEMHQVLAPAGRRVTTATLCQALASHYPVLTRYLPRLRRGIGETEPYYMALFKGVALGLTWWKQQPRSH